MTDRPDVDVLEGRLRDRILMWGNPPSEMEALDDLSDLAALARRVEVADLRHQTDLRIVREQRDRAKAAEAERDRLRATLRIREESEIPMVPEGAQRELNRLRERVAELEAALELAASLPADSSAVRVAELEAALLAVKHHPDTPEHIRRYVTDALADDGGGADEDYLTEPSDGRDLRGGRLP